MHTPKSMIIQQGLAENLQALVVYWLDSNSLPCPLFVLFIPEGIMSVIGMEFFLILWVHMPEGFVDGAFDILLLPVMGKRAPPVLHDHHQIGHIPEERHAKRAVKLAVEEPEKPVTRKMERGNVEGRLVVTAVTVGNPGRHEFPI